MARHARKAKTYSKETFSMSLDGDIQAQLKDFFGDIVNEVYRPAAFVAATVLYDEVIQRVPSKTGKLKSAIYRYREKQGAEDKSIFYVGVNKRKAPHWWLVEHGHWQRKQSLFLDGKWVTLDRPVDNPKYIPAKPYFRPAVDEKMQDALQAGINEFKRRFENK